MNTYKCKLTNIVFKMMKILLGDSYEVDIYKDKDDQNQLILSDVRRCLLAMPLVAGFLCCLLAYHTIEKTKKLLVCTIGILKISGNTKAEPSC